MNRNPKTLTHGGRIVAIDFDDFEDELADVHVGSPAPSTTPATTTPAPPSATSPTTTTPAATMPATTPATPPPPPIDCMSILTALMGPCIESGTCDDCHYKTPDGTEVFADPSFDCRAQTYTKTVITAAVGALGGIAAGFWGFFGGLLAGNLIARPIVGAIARTLPAESAPPAGSTFLMPMAEPLATVGRKGAIAVPKLPAIAVPRVLTGNQKGAIAVPRVGLGAPKTLVKANQPARNLAGPPVAYSSSGKPPPAYSGSPIVRTAIERGNQVTRGWQPIGVNAAGQTVYTNTYETTAPSEWKGGATACVFNGSKKASPVWVLLPATKDYDDPLYCDEGPRWVGRYAPQAPSLAIGPLAGSFVFDADGSPVSVSGGPARVNRQPPRAQATRATPAAASPPAPHKAMTHHAPSPTGIAHAAAQKQDFPTLSPQAVRPTVQKQRGG